MARKATEAEIVAWAEANVNADDPATLIPLIADILPTTSKLELSLPRRKVLAVKTLREASRFNQKTKAELAGVSVRTWYNAEHDPQFLAIARDFTKSRFSAHVPEIWASYEAKAMAGDKGAMEYILQQSGILDKPEKGDTNITVAVTIEQRKELEETRNKNQRLSLESLDHFYISDN